MRKYLFLMFALMLFSYGCASTLNPYSGDFTCPQTESGKCVSILEAYQESVGQKRGTILSESSSANNTMMSNAVNEYSNYENLYSEALFDRLKQVLVNPKTPIIAPPKVIRIMVLPYTNGQKEFFDSRYIYLVVDDFHWVLHDIREPL
ncbi:MAG: TraV family lipoprotein [Candidatus Micrarchaeia archaeon]